jgi:hypothetical protein
MSWTMIDSRTGRRCTIASYPTRDLVDLLPHLEPGSGLEEGRGKEGRGLPFGRESGERP